LIFLVVPPKLKLEVGTNRAYCTCVTCRKLIARLFFGEKAEQSWHVINSNYSHATDRQAKNGCKSGSVVVEIALVVVVRHT